MTENSQNQQWCSGRFLNYEGKNTPLTLLFDLNSPRHSTYTSFALFGVQSFHNSLFYEMDLGNMYIWSTENTVSVRVKIAHVCIV